jgi:hypothetical protein
MSAAPRTGTRERSTREHLVRVLGYHRDRLANEARDTPAHRSPAECAAYAQGVAAAERRMNFDPIENRTDGGP